MRWPCCFFIYIYNAQADTARLHSPYFILGLKRIDKINHWTQLNLLFGLQFNRLIHDIHNIIYLFLFNAFSLSQFKEKIKFHILLLIIYFFFKFDSNLKEYNYSCCYQWLIFDILTPRVYQGFLTCKIMYRFTHKKSCTL